MDEVNLEYHFVDFKIYDLIFQQFKSAEAWLPLTCHEKPWKTSSNILASHLFGLLLISDLHSISATNSNGLILLTLKTLLPLKPWIRNSILWAQPPIYPFNLTDQYLPLHFDLIQIFWYNSLNFALVNLQTFPVSASSSLPILLFQWKRWFLLIRG